MMSLLLLLFQMANGAILQYPRYFCGELLCGMETSQSGLAQWKEPSTAPVPQRTWNQSRSATDEGQA